ncbi:hypothetical protein [Planctomycetes bacterium K23_9]|uniref:Heparinase II/III-like protein n=1 Tax=Stieleria marina TaxID=1930275 RepID=A0A517NY79_9BACT|nr:hypothetical protein K239x_40840 [Planctomycetes bacterium K23_9]
MPVDLQNDANDERSGDENGEGENRGDLASGSESLGEGAGSHSGTAQPEGITQFEDIVKPTDTAKPKPGRSGRGPLVSTDADDEATGAIKPTSIVLSAEAKDQWKSLRKKIRLRAEKQSAKSVFGSAAKRGGVYRWGIEASSQTALQPMDLILSRLACGKKVKKKEIATIDWSRELESIISQISTSDAAPIQCVRAVMWAAAMPSLIDHLDYRSWWDLLGELQRLRESAMQKGGPASLTRLLLGGELGLTLAWRLVDLPSCRRLKKSSIDTVLRWCEHEEDSIAASIQGVKHSRIGLASLLRCRSVMQSTMSRKFTKQQKNVLADLGTWVAALTTYRGGIAFGPTGLTMDDDTAKGGLLDTACSCDPDALRPAMNAARGKSQTGGRLVWELSLPETVHHCDQSKLAVMMCEWDVSVGRVHIDYSGQTMQIEAFGKKRAVIAGPWESSIEINGNEQRPTGPWVSTCEYTDDDVHYLELEQSWSGGVILQRQFMTVRDDRTVLLSDSVLPRDPADKTHDRTVRYSSRLPVAEDTKAKEEPETREVILAHKRNQTLVVPLSANEWRVGATAAALRMTDDQNFLLSASGKGRLYVPLWLDFQSSRFKRKRTWRQLTVADDLRIVGSDEAVGFRIQSGSEQWMLYRSLQGTRCRSVLGKHLVTGFFAGRFYLNDGSIEEIVSVDDTDMQ